MYISLDLLELKVAEGGASSCQLVRSTPSIQNNLQRNRLHQFSTLVTECRGLHVGVGYYMVNASPGCLGELWHQLHLSNGVVDQRAIVVLVRLLNVCCQLSAAVVALNLQRTIGTVGEWCISAGAPITSLLLGQKPLPSMVLVT